MSDYLDKVKGKKTWSIEICELASKQTYDNLLIRKWLCDITQCTLCMFKFVPRLFCVSSNRSLIITNYLTKFIISQFTDFISGPLYDFLHSRICIEWRVRALQTVHREFAPTQVDGSLESPSAELRGRRWQEGSHSWRRFSAGKGLL